jgi:putative tricarboxylic transport membrane protein
MHRKPNASPPLIVEDTNRTARHQTLIALGALLVSALLVWGALAIPSAAGYAGVGPNFLPWLVAVVLALCGGLLLREARAGGWRDVEPPSGAPRGDWRALAWVSAGVLLNAALITGFEVKLGPLQFVVPGIGFVLSCTLCFVLGVRGLRLSEGRPGGGAKQLATDALIGLAISAPVFWMFTKLLAINLPRITASGWI